LAERFLDRVMQVVALVLTNFPSAIPPQPRHPQDLAFADTRTEEHGYRADELEVLLSDELVCCRSRQTERDEDAFQRRERDIDLLAQSREGSARARRPPPADLDAP